MAEGSKGLCARLPAQYGQAVPANPNYVSGESYRKARSEGTTNDIRGELGKEKFLTPQRTHLYQSETKRNGSLNLQKIRKPWCSSTENSDYGGKTVSDRRENKGVE